MNNQNRKNISLPSDRTQEQGKCPVCDNYALTYGEIEEQADGICYPWTCDACGASGKECYAISFKGHQDVTAILTREDIQKALQCLADNGIEKGECAVVLQALCYILMDTEIENLLQEEDWND